MPLSGDVFQGLGAGLSRAGSSPGINALIRALLQQGGEPDKPSAPGPGEPGLRAGGPQPSPLAIGGGEPGGLFEGSSLGGSGLDLSAILGAPNLEPSDPGPTSGELGAQAAAAGESAAAAQATAETRASLASQIPDLTPEMAEALGLSSTTLLNEAQQAAAARDQEARPERGETPAQARTARRRTLDDAARVAVAEAQAEGVQGPNAVFDVAGRMGLALGSDFSNEELTAAAARATPQSLRKEPKEDSTSNDEVAAAVSRIRQFMSDSDPRDIAAAVRRTDPENADAILKELGISDAP